MHRDSAKFASVDLINFYVIMWATSCSWNDSHVIYRRRIFSCISWVNCLTLFCFLFAGRQTSKFLRFSIPFVCVFLTMFSILPWGYVFMWYNSINASGWRLCHLIWNDVSFHDCRLNLLELYIFKTLFNIHEIKLFQNEWHSLYLWVSHSKL